MLLYGIDVSPYFTALMLKVCDSGYHIYIGHCKGEQREAAQHILHVAVVPNAIPSPSSNPNASHQLTVTLS